MLTLNAIVRSDSGGNPIIHLTFRKHSEGFHVASMENLDEAIRWCRERNILRDIYSVRLLRIQGRIFTHGFIPKKENLIKSQRNNNFDPVFKITHFKCEKHLSSFVYPNGWSFNENANETYISDSPKIGIIKPLSCYMTASYLSMFNEYYKKFISLGEDS